jgi:hypothetical protein
MRFYDLAKRLYGRPPEELSGFAEEWLADVVDVALINENNDVALF